MVAVSELETLRPFVFEMICNHLNRVGGVFSEAKREFGGKAKSNLPPPGNGVAKAKAGKKSQAPSLRGGDAGQRADGDGISFIPRLEMRAS
jgi:hypothetical protein